MDEGRLILYTGRAVTIWRGLNINYKFQPGQIALDILPEDYEAILLDARFQAKTGEEARPYPGDLAQQL